MMASSTAVLVWNRAAVRDRCGRLAKGNCALAAFLYAHGLIMNDGVIHAAEMMHDDEFDDAVAGYEFFGLRKVGELLARAKELLRAAVEIGPQEALLDSEYRNIIPDDSALFAAFERHFVACPGDFESTG